MREPVNDMTSIRGKIVLIFLTLSILTACSSSPAPMPTPSETTTAVPILTPTPIPTPIRLGEYELLSPEDMRSDLDELFHRIETTHPNPYAKRSKAEVDLERQKIYDKLDQPMNMIEFYQKVVPLVASLGDFHTQVILPEDTINELEKSELFFPFLVKFDGLRAFITTNYSDNSDIPSGTELLSLNDIPLSNIQNDPIFQVPNRVYDFSWIMDFVRFHSGISG